MNNKNLPIVLFIFLMISCSSLETNRIAPGYQQAYLAIKSYFAENNNTSITPLVIKNIPYASGLLRIGRGPVGLVILESVIGSKYIWVSEDGVYIVMQNGRIIETRGLHNNLIDFYAAHDDNIASSSEVKPYYSYYSYDEPKLINLKFKSSVTDKGISLQKLFMENKQLRLIEENINNEYLGWTRNNKFWVDESGFTWKLEQYISPRLPVISFEVTKKPKI